MKTYFQRLKDPRDIDTLKTLLPHKLSRRSFNVGLVSVTVNSYLSSFALSLASDTPVVVNAQFTAYLMADMANRSSSLLTKTDETNGHVKRFWVEGWRDPQQHFSWTIDVEKAGRYEVTLMVSAPVGTRLELTGPKNKLNLLCKSAYPNYFDFNWDRITLSESLSLPKGRSVIDMRLLNPVVTTGRVGAALKSVELLNLEARPALDARIKASRSDTSWLNTAKFGFMCQCGEWSYPPRGPHKPWPEMVEAFDVDRFVEMVESTGAGYAIWSATWRHISSLHRSKQSTPFCPDALQNAI